MRQALRIVVPPTSLALTTVASVKNELGAPDPSFYSRAPALINQASRMIVKYTGREFARKTVEETFTYEYGSSYDVSSPLMLTERPLVELLSITGDDTLWDTTCVDYTSNGLLYLPRFFRKTAIRYTCGYVLPDEEGVADRDLPDDIERACIDTVLTLWYRPDRGDPAIKMDRVDGVGITTYYDAVHPTAGALPPSAIGLLTDYRASR